MSIRKNKVEKELKDSRAPSTLSRNLYTIKAFKAYNENEHALFDLSNIALENVIIKNFNDYSL